MIIVSNPKISCNIVWIHKKDIAEGWSESRLFSAQILFVASSLSNNFFVQGPDPDILAMVARGSEGQGEVEKAAKDQGGDDDIGKGGEDDITKKEKTATLSNKVEKATSVEGH